MLVRPTVLSAVLFGILGLVAAAVVLICLFIRYARKLLERADTLLDRAEVLLIAAGRTPVARTDGADDQPLPRDQRYLMLQANADEYEAELADPARRITRDIAAADTDQFPAVDPATAPAVRPDIAAGARLVGSAGAPGVQLPEGTIRPLSFALAPDYQPITVFGEAVPAFRAFDPAKPPLPDSVKPAGATRRPSPTPRPGLPVAVDAADDKLVALGLRAPRKESA